MTIFIIVGSYIFDNTNVMNEMQRPTVRHYAEMESKLEISIGPLTLEIWKSSRRWEGSILEVKEDGGHQKNITYQVN